MHLPPEILATMSMASMIIIALLLIIYFFKDNNEIKKLNAESSKVLDNIEKSYQNSSVDNFDQISQIIKNHIERRKILNGYYHSQIIKDNLSFYISIVMIVLGSGLIVYQIIMDKDIDMIKTVSTIVVEVVSIFFIGFYVKLRRSTDAVLKQLQISDDIFTKVELMKNLPESTQNDLLSELIRKN